MVELESLIQLSGSVSLAPALTQGGGGNTSVKSGDEMLIKASGFRLDEVAESKGWVRVNFKPIQSFLQKKTDELNLPDADLKEYVNKQIIGDKTYLPSMETGFHAALNQYVIHTHPIIANLLLCSKEGEKKLNEIFKADTFTILPFLNPGYYLSKAIADINDISPIIFLKNHGLIIHGKNEQDTIDMHQYVIKKLSDALHYNLDFHFELNQVSEQLYELKSQWLSSFFSQPGLLFSTWFPDQAVVIGRDYIYQAKYAITKKLNFIKEGEHCFIRSGHKNAMAIAENMAALSNILQFNHGELSALNPIPDLDVAYILGMDMEKYRQGLLG